MKEKCFVLKEPIESKGYCGYVYAPYIPMICTPVICDDENNMYYSPEVITREIKNFRINRIIKKIKHILSKYV